MTLPRYYRDPDGNRMEFHVDCCADAQEAHAIVNGESFAANPIGVEVDFEALLAQYRSGAPAEALLTAGEFDVGDGIGPGETMTLEWDKSTDDSHCEWAFSAAYDDGTFSDPVVIDFCEDDLELVFDP